MPPFRTCNDVAFRVFLSLRLPTDTPTFSRFEIEEFLLDILAFRVLR